ncbi:MAG: ATP synthase F1 subunit epsilon [Candidatus Omnitrophica bacterium]|nr:ATP synthase F1 subunit epsilon [Candidatus Omnitrophota bacterium]
MNDKVFQLEILTPERTVFTGSAASLVAPGALGYLGILANHAPLMTTLTPGKIICRDSGGQSKIFQSTGAGFLEVHHNQVTLLADGIAP